MQTQNSIKRARRNFYRLHRFLGITALVPVIFWTLSGLSHPFMSNWFRPYIAREIYRPATMDKMHPQLSLEQVMDLHQMKAIRNFGLVRFNGATFYQVLEADSIYRYYSASDGKMLPEGDKLYAIYLARYFTEDPHSAIKSSTLRKTFDEDYPSINHLLPVWKISFDRPDGMDIYVETGQNRMGTFNNNTRKAFLWVFQHFHNWSFLAAIGGERFRIGFLLTVVCLMFLSMFSGIIVYGLLWKKFKQISRKRKETGNDKRILHRYHRQIGLAVSLVMFCFFISGGFHLLVKLYNLEPDEKHYSQLIRRNELKLPNLNLPVADSSVQKLSLVRFNRQVYYRIQKGHKKIIYLNTGTGQALPEGDKQYALFLAGFFRKGLSSEKTERQAENIQVSPVSQFDNEYGFINKRLPVQKVSYPGNENWYIETSTAALSATVKGLDRAEGLSFIFLHKYFLMSWAGKDIRDIITMISAAGVLVVSLFGFVSFIKNK